MPGIATSIVNGINGVISRFRRAPAAAPATPQPAAPVLRSQPAALPAPSVAAPSPLTDGSVGRRVSVSGLGGLRNDATAATNRFNVDTSFQSYTAGGDTPVDRGFIRVDAQPTAGGCRVHVESFHHAKDDKLTLYLLAEILDPKTSQLRIVTLSVLANQEVLNKASYRGNAHFDLSYADLDAYLAKRNQGLKVNPGTTSLAVAARWSDSHQAGGFGRGGRFRLPAVSGIGNVVQIRSRSDSEQTDLPLDLQVTYPAALVNVLPALDPAGAIVSRLESELKGTAQAQEMTAALTKMYGLVGELSTGNRKSIDRILGPDWTIEPVSRYWLRDDGSTQRGQSGRGAFTGYRVGANGFPLQDPMYDAYMDSKDLGVTRTEGAVRLRKNAQATGINVKPGGGRRDPKTGITQRIEIGLQLVANASTAEARATLSGLAANGRWSDSVFNQAQKELYKLDKELKLQDALIPWVDLEQLRHKFTVKNTKTGVEVELSFDEVVAQTNRPEHADAMGRPRRVAFYVLEAELDHLQLNSQNQTSFAAADATFSHFYDDRTQDEWLKTTSAESTLDIDPRLHELADLENRSFRQTGSYRAFEDAVGKLVPELFPRGLGFGRQKAAHAAQLFGLVHFDAEDLKREVQSLTERAGYAWSPELAKGLDACMADPQKRTILEKTLASGVEADPLKLVATFAANVVPSYDIAAAKRRVAGHLESLGYRSNPQVEQLLDLLDPKRLPAASFERMLSGMAGLSGAKMFEILAQTLGILTRRAPAPTPAPELLFGDTALSMRLRDKLRQIGCEPKQQPELERWFAAAVVGGVDSSKVRGLITGLSGSQPDQTLLRFVSDHKLTGLPTFRASAAYLAEQLTPVLRNHMLVIDESWKPFFETLAEKTTFTEARDFVSQSFGSWKKTYVDVEVPAKAKALGIVAPNIAVDFPRIDRQLAEDLRGYCVRYDAGVQKLVRDLFAAGNRYQEISASLRQTGEHQTFDAVLKESKELKPTGQPLPTLTMDIDLVVTKVTSYLAGNAMILDGARRKVYVQALWDLGLSTSKIASMISYIASAGRFVAKRDYAPNLQGPLPPLPLDVTGMCQVWAGRHGTAWSTMIEQYVQAALPKANEAETFGPSKYLNSGSLADLLEDLVKHSGMARPRGV